MGLVFRRLAREYASVKRSFEREEEGRERVVPLPEKTDPKLSAAVEEARRVHEADVARGTGRVTLPRALERKYRGAASSLPWMWVFPAAGLVPGSVDPGFVRGPGGITKRRRFWGRDWMAAALREFSAPRCRKLYRESRGRGIDTPPLIRRITAAWRPVKGGRLRVSE